MMKRLVGIILVVALLLAAVSALAEEWNCLTCGNTSSGNFCSNCGSAKPSKDWICSVCGSEATNYFCSMCGAPRNGSTPAPAVTATPSPTSTPAPTYTPVPCERNGEGYTVTQEYRWDTSRYHYFGMVIRNTSGNKCGYDIQVLYYDAGNNQVGVSNPSVAVCDSGYEVLVTCSSDTTFDHVGYTITPTSTSYNDVHSYVNVTAEIAGDKVILTGINSGTVAAEFVEYRVLFINDAGLVVGSDWGYLVDSDSELKPGKKEYREESCSEDFSSVVVYFEGRTRKSVVNAGIIEVIDPATNIASGEDYEITHEYSWSSSRYQYHAFVLKNTSDTAQSYNLQILYYDKDDKIVGVSNPNVTVCGSGYEVMVSCSSSVKYDHLTYVVTSKKANYADVHDSVEVSTNISGKKVIITGTNNGSVAAQFVEYHCLFLNNAGEVVGSGWGYLVDNKSELKPGASEIREEKCSEEFSSVVIYFEGRRSK